MPPLQDCGRGVTSSEQRPSVARVPFQSRRGTVVTGAEWSRYHLLARTVGVLAFGRYESDFGRDPAKRSFTNDRGPDRRAHRDQWPSEPTRRSRPSGGTLRSAASEPSAAAAVLSSMDAWLGRTGCGAVRRSNSVRVAARLRDGAARRTRRESGLSVGQIVQCTARRQRIVFCVPPRWCRNAAEGWRSPRALTTGVQPGGHISTGDATWDNRFVRFENVMAVRCLPLHR